ncbi:MAG: phage tail protein [Treponema sp.]|nr:phage tail protein [Treponema sp.]
MEIASVDVIKKLCVGLDLYKSQNLIAKVHPELKNDIEIKYVESPHKRFTVIGCDYEKSSRKAILIVTSTNPIARLPSMYQENDFLRKFLMIFQHMRNNVSLTLDNMDNIFRPMETPSKFLPVLADWFGVDFDLFASEEIARKVLQYTIPLYRYRGTKIGLSALVYLVTGVKPVISEGSLPFDEFDVTGKTDIESPIMEDLSGIKLFSVYLPVLAKDFTKEEISKLYRLIDREKPVGTLFYLYFKKEKVVERKKVVISEDIESIGEEGFEI